ncbi:dTDP-4-dehydrorhamnose 3,5-epimerase family protein [Nocardiopsis dassonvillei]|uniref:dTDP-4-dehydrorhamnose 3,5-epimerase family protein n=1 Tax=Nocardiopsis dassonvillei TaxID=2014 RepID=UPI003638D874
MQARELAVVGAFEFSATIHEDERGFFVSPFEEKAFMAAVGHPLFAPNQVSVSKSRYGVLRGVHFTATPPGRPKYAYCPRGRAYDIVVDLRTGSPTYGDHDVVELDQERMRAVYLPVGVGHAFVALEDNTSMCYLLSGEYVPEDELALHPLDPALGLPLPEGLVPIMSERDVAAPTLTEAEESGLLPDYATCRALERALWQADGAAPT